MAPFRASLALLLVISTSSLLCSALGKPMVSTVSVGTTHAVHQINRHPHWTRDTVTGPALDTVVEIIFAIQHERNSFQKLEELIANSMSILAASGTHGHGVTLLFVLYYKMSVLQSRTLNTSSMASSCRWQISVSCPYVVGDIPLLSMTSRGSSSTMDASAARGQPGCVLAC